MPPALLLLLIGGWLWTSVPAWWWTALVAAVLLLPAVLDALIELLRKPQERDWLAHFKLTGMAALRPLALALLTLTALPRRDLALRGAHVVHASRPVAVAYPQIRAPQCLPQPRRFLPGDLDSARAGAGAGGAVHTKPLTRLGRLGAVAAAVAGGAGDYVVDQFAASSARSTFERRATALSARAGAPHLALFRRFRHRRRTLAASR